MSFSIEFADETQEYQARIKVIGCGGSGGNAVNTMINFGLEGVEFIVVNTDIQALNANAAPTKLTIGGNVTRGLGAGADPERGRKAALEDVQKIKELIAGADMVFVTAGMGGGTGTGAAPIIAQIAREEGALTVGVVTKPFLFEGRQRARRADIGLAQLSEHVDTLITIPNQKLLMLGDEDLSFIEACRKADEVLFQAVKGISDLITQNGMVNVDFADVRTIMSHQGRALMGTGIAKGQNRAKMAAEMAISSPLLDDISVEGARGVLINVVGGPDLKMREISEAASLIQEQAHEEANIIFGSTVDEALGDNVKVTVIATGFDLDERMIPIESASRISAAPPTAHSMSRPAYQLPSQPPVSREVARESISQMAARSQRESQVQPSARVARETIPSSRPAISSREAAQSSRDVGSQERVERSDRAAGSFPAFETDWDVPAFQRRGR